MDLEGQPEKDACQNAEQGVLNQFVTEPILLPDARQVKA